MFTRLVASLALATLAGAGALTGASSAAVSRATSDRARTLTPVVVRPLARSEARRTAPAGALVCLGGDDEVSPRCATDTASVNETARVAVFTITTASPTGDTYDLTCAVTAPIRSCSVSSPVDVISPTEPATVRVLYSSGVSGGTGTVKLTATGEASGAVSWGTYTITVNGPTYDVDVTPDAQELSVPALAPASQMFTLQLTGTAGSASYVLRASCSGRVTACAPSQDTVVLPQHGSSVVGVDFQSDSAGTSGVVTLLAELVADTTILDSGWVNVSALASSTYGIAISQKGETHVGSANAVDSVAFTLTNTGNTDGVTYTLTRGGTGQISLSGTIPSSIALNAGAEATVFAKYLAQGASTSGRLWLVAQRAGGSERDSGFVATEVPAPPVPRRYVVLSPRASEVYHYHEPGVRKTIADIDVRNGGDTTIQVSLTPSTSNATVMGSLLIQQLPSGSQVSSATISLAPSAGLTYRVSGLTGGGGSATVSLLATQGAFADTALVVDSVTTAAPTLAVVGDSVLVAPVYADGGSAATNGFYLTNGGSPADWSLTTTESSVTPMLTNLTGPRTVHLGPDQTMLIQSSGTVPDSAGITQLCTNISGYGVTKQVCGEVRSRPSNRVVRLTDALTGNDTLAADSSLLLNGTLTLRVLDAQDLVDNPYSLDYVLRARSLDPSRFRVTQIHALPTSDSCPDQTWSGDSIVFTFRGTSTPSSYSPCLTRTFEVSGQTGKGPGGAALEITAMNLADEGNRQTAIHTIGVLPRFGVGITQTAPRVQYVPSGQHATLDFAVTTGRRFTWNVQVATNASFRVDSVYRTDSLRRVWSGASSTASFPEGFSDYQQQRYRVYLTALSVGSSIVDIDVTSTDALKTQQSAHAVAYLASAVATAASADVSGMPPDVRPRSSCMTFGAGAGVAWQCGDLIAMHSTVPYESRGEWHGVTLLYNSNTAAPRQAVIATVGVPAGQVPTAIRAIVRVGADSLSLGAPDTVFYAGQDFWNAPRRIAPRLDLAGLSTGLYTWQLELAPMSNATPGPSTIYRGTILTVNDGMANPVGTGWQVAGVDRIYWAGPSAPDSSLIIVEGDGTAKLFTKVAGGWLSPRGDFTTLRADSAYIVRRFKGGLEKWYRPDWTALARAVDAFGNTAHYYWSQPQTGTWRLDSLRDAAGVLSALYYGSGQLDSIRAPVRAGIPALRIGHTGSDITTIWDPDGRTTTFGYAANHLMTSRAGRVGGQVGSFTYDSAYTVSVASGVDLHRYHAARSGGFADGHSVGTAAAPAVSVDTADRVLFANGRGDTTRIAVNAYGLPSYLQPPAGGTTTIFRNPATLLPDSIFNSYVDVVRETYDPWGDLTHTSTAWKVKRDSTQPDGWQWDSVRTSYVYDSTYHHATQITQPDGVITRLYYTGPYRDSLAVADTTLVRFAYYGRDLQDSSYALPHDFKGAAQTPSLHGLLKSVWERGHQYPFEIGYGSAGNVTWEQTPEQHARGGNERTQYRYEAELWPDTVIDPSGATTVLTFDAMRRVVHRKTTGSADRPAIVAPGAAWQATLTRTDSTVYDDANNIVTTLTPSPAGLFTSKTYYDGLGRVVKDCPYTASTGASVCDQNTWEDGFLVRQVLRNGAVHDLSYDGIGRVTRHVFTAPSATSLQAPEARAYTVDTLQFDYADQGLLFATNRAARIWRHYVGPRLEWEIQSIGNFVADPSSTNAPEAHQLMFRYTYDPMGRVVRREMGAPALLELAPCPPDVPCTHDRDFAVDTVHSTSALDTAKVVTTYHYDALGRVDSLHWGGWTRRLGEPALPARGFHFQYDAAGRWVGMTNTVAAGGQTSPYTLSIAYDEDDQVDAMTWAGSDHRLALYDTLDVPGGGPTSTRDALGRPTRETSWEARAQPLAYDGLGQLVLKGTEWLQYDTAGAGQLVHGYRTGTSTYNALGQLAENDNADSVRYAYDAQGNRVSEDYAQQGFDGRPEVQYAYDGANHMISRRKQATPGDSSVVASAYWYDALGRRVIASDSTTDASGFVQRYYYDAAGPNAGDVAFVQDNIQTAPDEFRPSIRATAATMSLGGPMGPNHVLLRFPDAGYAVSNGVPLHEVFEHQNRQFTTYGESAPDGTPQGVTPEYGAFGTPGQGAGTQASGYTGAPTGSGGLVFLRNRYYDPNTGSFTQEDPIGLAGGMNRYQYAGNDPVNFSDPFGLCPCPPDNDCDTPAGALGGDRFGGGGAGRSWGDRDGHAEAAAPKGPGELDKLANVVALAETNDYRASELRAAALDAGWKEYQKNPTGPLFYRDKNGVDRLVLKKGSPRAPGSEGPHAEFRDASGKRVDARGRRVTRNNPRNHTPIVWDLPNQQR